MNRQVKVKLKPIGNRVLAKKLESEETIRGGIILPESVKQKQETVEIIALGTGKLDKDGKEMPFAVKVGDRVLMDKYAAQEVSFDGEEYVIINADEIIAIVE